ncbi:MAG: sulfatase [Acidimicrobiales bacterium]|mgnify:CR=1 FL=1|nr:sulfatase [Acidimicrobiales bacterium]
MRLLYIDIDTLRFDHLGCAGYHRDTTPNIDELARGGVQFKNVYASDVPCLPSRTAFITGMFGIRNGVVNHGGLAADLRPEGAERNFFSRFSLRSWASTFFLAGWHTASISSFPFRHGASWWNNGFMEAMNLMRGFGGERADEVLPGALDWLDRRGEEDNWLLHVHLWDPHTPYTTPDDYGNPFSSDPVPSWHTEAVRKRNWDLSGPHSAQEPWGFRPDEWGDPPVRQPWDASSMEAVKQIFDGYDVGVKYADDAVGVLMNKLTDLGVEDDTAVLISSDHGEAFGELGVYADHQAADEATCHIPAVLYWPGIDSQVNEGLHYHLDVAATVVDLAGMKIPQHWDGRSLVGNLQEKTSGGREHLVLSQGAWSCQRSVRWGEHLYMRTWHDGYHGHWEDKMLFNIAQDPHEQNNLSNTEPMRVVEGDNILQEWTDNNLSRSFSPCDPMEIVLDEGGPFHVRGKLPDYLQRLRATGRSNWAEVLKQRHPKEARQQQN